MRILVTGGTGFIGRHLVQALRARGDAVDVLSRQSAPAGLGNGVTVYTRLEQVPEGVDAVINLAGAPIARRWSEQYKAVLRDSRLRLTAALVEWMRTCSTPPAVLVSGSAMGYYGSQGDRTLNEQAAPKGGFSHDLCAAWEHEAAQASELGVRVCCVRTGLVLGRDGGALEKMVPLFKWGLGGPIGSGRQWVSWIHIDDEVNAILHLLDQPALSGAFNLTAPNPCTHEVFSKMLASVLRRPALLRMPAPLMRLLLGEAAELVVCGQRVVPEGLLASGYRFRYTTVDAALEQVLTPG